MARKRKNTGKSVNNAWAGRLYEMRREYYEKGPHLLGGSNELKGDAADRWLKKNDPLRKRKRKIRNKTPTG